MRQHTRQIGPGAGLSGVNLKMICAGSLEESVVFLGRFYRVDFVRVHLSDYGETGVVDGGRRTRCSRLNIR